MLGDVCAGGGRDERSGGGDIEPLGGAAAPGTAGIDEVRHVDVDLRGHGTHGLHRARDLVDGLALGLETDEHARDLGGRGFSTHDGVENRAGLRSIQILAGHQQRQGFVHLH